MTVGALRCLSRNAIRLAAAAACLFAASCLHHHGPAMVLLIDQKKLMIRGDCPASSATCSPLNPTEADQYASQQYDGYKQSGFVTLQPGMRLRVVAPLMRAGAAEPIARQAETADGSRASVTMRSSPDLLGYETVTYTMDPEPGGALTAEIDTIDLKAAGKTDSGALKSTDYLKGIPPRSMLRLYFQMRHSMKDHDSVLLASGSLGKLNEASGKFEEKPDEFCAAPEAGTKCIAFPKFTAVNAEVRVHVRKQAVYLPLSATVADALRAAGVDDPKSVTDKLKITRVWDSHRVPVKFDNTAMALRLTIVGEDRIRY
jgi:hypothetical protein